MEMADAIPHLVRRAHALAAEMMLFVAKSPTSRRRAIIVAVKSRALAAALGLASDDDILTAANELTELEALGHSLMDDPETVRPPPSSSGTFVIERRKASTNRLLAVVPPADNVELSGPRTLRSA